MTFNISATIVLNLNDLIDEVKRDNIYIYIPKQATENIKLTFLKSITDFC
jgi:hypothetical protein